MPIIPEIPGEIYPDRESLRSIAQFFENVPTASETRLQPDPHDPRMVRTQFENRTDEQDSSVLQLTVQWFYNGDFSIHCFEIGSDQDWQCRWDRHNNSGYTRTHFHHPPDGDRITGLEDNSTHPIEIISTISAAIQRRSI